MNHTHVSALLRLSLGWIFLWAFLDKTFGFGFATSPDKAWLAGGSPTMGFLSHSTGPFSEVFQSMVGQPWVDGLFMIGLLLIGLALMLGVGMRIAAITGSLLMVLMWLAVFPKTTNPFMDDHLMYVLVLWVLVWTRREQAWSLNDWWSHTKLVKAHPWLA